MNSWACRRQILSIMTQTFRLAEIQEFIPGLTRYLFKTARQHSKDFGRGAVVPKERIVRIRISEQQIDHFLSFVTSPHILQDLPFGETVLTLSDGSHVQMPKVILTMIPERIIQQYNTFCGEANFVPPSTRSLRRILDACSTTYR